MSLIDCTAVQPTDWKCPVSVNKPTVFDPDCMTLEVFLDQFNKFCLDSKMSPSPHAAQLLDFVSECIYNKMFEAQLMQTPMWEDVCDYLVWMQEVQVRVGS